ncbi:hypothetical protein D3C81_1983440 [compost metagenome]
MEHRAHEPGRNRIRHEIPQPPDVKCDHSYDGESHMEQHCGKQSETCGQEQTKRDLPQEGNKDQQTAIYTVHKRNRRVI